MMPETLQAEAQALAYLKKRVTIDPRTGCWIWQQSVGSHGYGNACYGRFRTAHRFSYAIHHGDPGTLHVLHRCGNRRCCNPEHLYAGTDKDNHLDCVQDGTHRPPPHLKGEQVGNAKLTDAQASEIKRALLDGMTRTDLANAYGVSVSTISLISRNLRYAHVPPFFPRQTVQYRPKLTPDQITEIKARLLLGETGRSIAADMGILPVTVSRVNCGKVGAQY